MKYLLCCILVLTVTCFANDVKPMSDAPKVIESVKEPSVLSQEEVSYVKTLYRDYITTSALQNLVQREDDQRSGAILSIKHPKDNPVVVLISTTLFKDYQDMENSLFETVYKGSDAKNGQRVWNLQGEYYFFLGKIKEKVDADPKYLDSIVESLKKIKK